MQYTFYKWRARTPASPVWHELGWCMTEEDAKTWAEQNGHQVERVPAAEDRRVNVSYGGALA